MNDIDKLLIGRNAIDNHNRNYLIKGVYTNPDNILLKEALMSIGMDITDFYTFDLHCVLYEIDKCYRVRSKADSTLNSFCDQCEGRSVPCYSIGCKTTNTGPLSNTIPPKEESEIYIDQQNYLNSVGINIEARPRAFQVLEWLDFNGHFPTHCCMQLYLIKEPAFNLFWQDFTSIKVFGRTMQNLIDIENNK